MASSKRRILTLRDWLSKFSGEDYQIIHDAKTDVKVKMNFAFIGLFVLVIFAISFYSCAHFIYQLFNENLMLTLPIGIFWGFMITNIYLLLLYTITPKILVSKERKNKGVATNEEKESSLLINMSIGFRIGFVVLIAIIIAQPWIITTFSTNARVYLDKYKQQYRNDFIIQADSILIGKEIKLLNEAKHEFNLVEKEKSDSALLYESGRVVFYKIQEDELFLSHVSHLRLKILEVESKWTINNRRLVDSLNTEITKLVEREILTDSLFILESISIPIHNVAVSNIISSTNNALKSIISEKNIQYKKLNSVLAASNFYIRQLQIINSHFYLSWLMTAFMIFVFILPIVLKYRIRNTSNFYQVKKSLEELIVTQEYERFKLTYSVIFKTKLNQSADFYESCIDPPFNTIKKESFKNLKDQNLLLSTIYSDAESSEANKYFVSETVS